MMARYTWTHSCGHEGEGQLYGPYVERERKVASYAGRPCPDCTRRQGLEKAQVASTALRLPNLVGSEKQVQWATKIRIELLDSLDIAGELAAELKRMGADDEALSEVAGMLPAMREALMAQTAASYWIDHRRLRGVALMRAVQREVLAETRG